MPLALLEHLPPQQKIIVVAPRRVAVKSAAQRMAQLIDEPIGHRVGFRTGIESQVSKDNRIEVVTEAIWVRQLQSAPECDSVFAVLFDEFHERNYYADLGLMFAHEVQQAFNESLNILVMSATLNMESLERYLGQPAKISIAGRNFAVTTEYSPSPSNLRGQHSEFSSALLENCYRQIVKATQQSDKDVLVFLPGRFEIEQLLEHLQSKQPDLQTLALYGAINWRQQQMIISGESREALAGGQTKQRVILATNIAETSVTIPNIGVVIDSGQMRVSDYDDKTTQSRLFSTAISQQNAVQRQGRAGREAEGLCIRLWPAEKVMPKNIQPELQRSDLRPLVLELAQWGCTDFEQVEWIDPPSQQRFTSAQQQLMTLGALTADKQLTKLGEQLLALGSEIELAYLLVQAAQHQQFGQAAQLAFALQEGVAMDDNQTLYQLEHNQLIAKTKQGLFHKRQQQWQSRLNTVTATQQPLLKLICQSFSLRIGKRDPNQLKRFHFSGGFSAECFDPKQGEQWAFCIALSVQKLAKGYRVRTALPLAAHEFNQYCGGQIVTDELLEFDSTKQAFNAFRVEHFHQLELARQTISLQSIANFDQQLRQFWHNQVRQPDTQVKIINPQLTALLNRANLVREHLDKTFAPKLTKQALLDLVDDWLLPAVENSRKLNIIDEIDKVKLLQQYLDWNDWQQLNQLCPERIAIPSGRSATIDYSGAKPVIAVKLQEMFGQAHSPSILNGKLGVTVHLLSPAGKPLQITDDLHSFWHNAYLEVKKEMKGRYPKHPWPDDPINALATSKTKRQLKQ